MKYFLVKENQVILTISGPSGVGKTTIANMLVSFIGDSNMSLAISATSRDPRPNEKHGVDYLFLTREEIETHIENGNSLEHIEYDGNIYSYLRHTFEDPISEGKDLVSVVAGDGITQLKKEFGISTVLSILLVPPSLEELESRLMGDGRTAESIKRRLRLVENEIEHYQNVCDYSVVCDDLEETLEEVLSLYYTFKSN